MHLRHTSHQARAAEPSVSRSTSLPLRRVASSRLPNPPRIRIPAAVLLVALPVALTLLSAAGVRTQVPSLAAGGSQIEWRTLDEHLRELTAPDLEGRGNGTEGARRAAKYIAARFRSAGLEPAGTSATVEPGAARVGGTSKATAKDAFFHPYSVFTGVRVEGVIGLQDNNRGYAFNLDYTPLGLSDDGDHTGDLVFAGYGVSAPDLGYDDYAGLDVTDKIVLAFLGEPGMRDPDSPFEGAAPTIHSDLYRKAEVAREHGAKGLILTPGPLYARDLDRVWKISSDVGFRNSGIMVCQMTNTAAKSLVEPAGLDLAVLQKTIDDRHAPLSSELPNRVEMKVRLRRVETEMVNVVAKVPGRSDRAVVLMANFDGYGMGPDNSAPVVHPSANDNASGIAALLECARVLEQMPQAERTVYFVASSGRRLTAAGSEALLRDRIVDPEKIELLVDVFALGTRNTNDLSVMGTGSVPGLGTLLSEVNRAVRAPVVLSTDRAVSSAGDHIPWFRAGVPVLTLFGGAYKELGTPLDTVEVIDWASFERRARFVYGLARAASEREEPFAVGGP